jgi:alpha/beta superfamily hydrolase
VYVCAHGAGGHIADRSIIALTDALRERGVGTVRFNFLYRSRGSRRPDPMPRLLACVEAVVSRVREELKPDLLVVGGRSMGGRAASVLVSRETLCDGLLAGLGALHEAGIIHRALHPSHVFVAQREGLGATVKIVGLGTARRLRSPESQVTDIGQYEGEAAMRAEFERILPAIRSGRYIPSVDHQTPPDVSLENYAIFRRLLGEYVEKAGKALENAEGAALGLPLKG